MFPHTVTLYVITEDEVTFEQTRHITVLRGVLLDATKAVNVNASGLENADAVNLYIPFDVDASDGVSLMKKRFVGAKEFYFAKNKDELWTLDTNNCFFVKGEVVDAEADFQYINLNFDNVYRVTKVDEKDFGSLQHWEVGGR